MIYTGFSVQAGIQLLVTWAGRIDFCYHPVNHDMDDGNMGDLPSTTVVFGFLGTTLARYCS